MSPVLSVYCKGLPASENNQLCMPLNMYICAFVYSIGVHWYFFFSSLWFIKKIKADSSLLVTTPDAVELWLCWRIWPTNDFLCDITANLLSASACQPINTVCLFLPSLRGHFLWHLGVPKSFYSEAFWPVSQLTDDPVLHVELTERIGTWWKSSIHREGVGEKERKV